MKLKNLMEYEVHRTIENLLKNRTDICTCDKCKLDMEAIALNNLKPKYVVTEKGSILAKVDTLSYQYDADILMEVIKAINKVGENPHHE